MKTKQILEECIKIHDRKSADYTTDKEANPKENFERAAIIASWFTKEEDKVYATLIGIKLARLAALRSNDREPNNESILDSFIDLTTYSALFGFSVTSALDSIKPENQIEEIDKTKSSQKHTFEISQFNFMCAKCLVELSKGARRYDLQVNYDTGYTFCSIDCKLIFTGMLVDAYRAQQRTKNEANRLIQNYPPEAKS